MTTILKRSGQEYELLGEEPHRRRDGKMTTLRVWLTRCATCGQETVVKTPNGGSFVPSRRCEEHRRPGFKVRHERKGRI